MTRLTRLLAGPVLLGSVLCSLTFAAAPGVEAAPSVYVVRSGDSLYAIASRLDVRLDDLLRVNRLSLTTVIHPGQRLTVPGTGGSGGGSGTTSYVVRAGDWLSRIASRHGVTLRALLDANGLTATSLIVPGQRLVIPGSQGGGGGGSGGGSPGSITYTVRAGDWLSRIASRHSVTLRALLDANGLTVTSLIVPGQQLRIPRSGGGGGGTPSTPPSSTGLDRVVGYALAQVGKPWRFFSRGPQAFDCSGLTLAAYAQIGVPLVHYSAAQAMQGTAVDFRNEPIRAGDLVFQDTNGDGVINHVGLAVSSSTWVHARSIRLAVAWGPLPPDGRIVAVRRVLR